MVVLSPVSIVADSPMVNGCNDGDEDEDEDDR